MNAMTNDESTITWHRRLGHMNYNALLKMRNGIKLKDHGSKLTKCETCAMGKQSRSLFPSSDRKSTQFLELVHSDLCGPMKNQSIFKAKYFLTFIDDYSKKVFCYFSSRKDQLVENFTEKRINTFRTDNGKEYMSDEFKKLLTSNGIKNELTCPYMAQQNGVAERYNRTIVEKARCMLQDSDLPKAYWGEAVNMAVYLINRSVCLSLVNCTPEEV